MTSINTRVGLTQAIISQKQSDAANHPPDSSSLRELCITVYYTNTKSWTAKLNLSDSDIVNQACSKTCSRRVVIMTHPACQHTSVTLQFPLSVYNHSNLSTLVMSNQDQMHLTMCQALCNSYEMALLMRTFGSSFVSVRVTPVMGDVGCSIITLLWQPSHMCGHRMQ